MSNTNVPVAKQWANYLEPLREDFVALDALLPNPLGFEREVKFAVQIILGNAALQSNDPALQASLRNCIIQVAACGISLNPAHKLCYLVPRKGVCCLDISGQGLVKIATDSGSVLAAKALVVRANDTFEFNGPFDMPVHKFDPFASDEARGPIIGAYSLAKLHNGTVVVDTLNLDTINRIRSVSKAKDGGDNPWSKWYEEMVKKTAIKRGYKSWPKTDRLSQADAILDSHEGLDDDALGIGTEGGPARPSRTGGASIAAQAAQQAQDSPERTALLAELEQLVRRDGQDAYAAKWETLSVVQKRMVGRAEHERLWALGDPNTVEMEAGEVKA